MMLLRIRIHSRFDIVDGDGFDSHPSSGELLCDLEHPDGSATCCIVTCKSTSAVPTIVSGHFDGSVMLWGVSSIAHITLDTRAGHVSGLLVAEDMLCVATSNGVVWGVDMGNEHVVRWTHAVGNSLLCALQRHGSVVLVAPDNMPVIGLDIRSGETLYQLRVHACPRAMVLVTGV